ncbi:Gfo/Idh/MocA family protein [Tessaracoccus caeni]|uniref:Gfo/Idh/MocA family protein n=1 Tax=Tessaracoccus caeni TaxID=3031239 RepID=UPI0023DAA063|nr:Gfo/Idh/MocA family oxidoreductase [Tessaracoccus caeni]MDF1489294.1 Gfo/Idh/MocA family oxidoreductase [Tessaracoccus caeni]
MESVRWGIFGTGGIAQAVAGDFQFVADAELAAVASRTPERAQAFARRHGVARAHGSYRAMLDDPDIDAVYIATPNSHHHDLALAAIDAGKAVLVEKSFTATYAGAQRVVDAARAKGVFAMEAMWTRFLPAISAAREVVAWGRIGEVLAVQGDLFAYRDFDPTNRLFAQELAGGALLDVGVYVVSFAHDFLGDVRETRCEARLYPNGVDAAASITLRHSADGLSSLACGLDGPGPGRMIIVGSKGWVEIDPRFHHASIVTINRQGVLPRIIEAPPTGHGYCHEFAEATLRILAGETESPTMPLDDTLEVMRILDDCLRYAGVSHTEADMSEDLQ